MTSGAHADIQADASRDARLDLAILCFFNPADVLGGSERIAWAEAGLLSGDRRVAFVSASPPVAGAPFPQLRVAGWTRSLYQAPGSRRNPLKLVALHLLNLFNPVAFIEALRVFRRLRPKVIHTHNLIALSPAIWFAARLAGARVVHTHHDLWMLCERATMTDSEGRACNESQLTCRVCRALRPAKRHLMAPISREVFPSRWLRDRLGRDGPIVPSFCTSGSRPSAGPTTPGPATVAYIGALTPHKLGPLLEAFPAATESGPEMQLVIAGSGPLEARVAAAAESSPSIRHLGEIDPHVRDRLLEEADVLVIPSTCAENSPVVFFEALAFGVPVIASDIGGITELERWGNVLLVPPGDPGALAVALVSLLADRDRLLAMRESALKHGAEASPERFVRQIDAVISELE